MSTFDGHPLLKAIVDKSSGAIQKSPVKDWKEVSGWGSAKRKRQAQQLLYLLKKVKKLFLKAVLRNRFVSV